MTYRVIRSSCTANCISYIYIYIYVHTHTHTHTICHVKDLLAKTDHVCVCVCVSVYIGEGNGNPLQYSFLENPMDRGVWRATVHGITRVGHDLATKPPPCMSVYRKGHKLTLEQEN